MTKEELSILFNQGNIVEELTRFFESNVCIPKGENRHRDSDVLHRWIEGEQLQMSFDGEEWLTKDKMSTHKYPYRIKPSEPIYEWFWFNTKEERVTATRWLDGQLDDEWIKLEETKRERK